MYLFKEQDSIDIPVKCKLCLEEIKFKLSADEYKQVQKFPIKRENIHGETPHKLIVYINKYLEIENFEIKDIVKKEDISYSKELTKQVLSNIGLDNDEIELYFRTTGREAVSLGEMAILTGKTRDECQQIAKKFVEKGLFKEIVGAKPHYTALPPYAALVSQLGNFSMYISDIKKSLPSIFSQSLSQLESQADQVKDLKESKDIMSNLKQNMLKQIHSQQQEFDETISAIDKIKEVSKEIINLEDYTKDFVETQITELATHFESINFRTSEIIKTQIEALQDEFEVIKSIISENLQKLRLGVIQQAVDQVIEGTVSARLREIVENLNVQVDVNQMVFADDLKRTTENLNVEIASKLKDSIENAINNIQGATFKTEDEKAHVLSELSENFNKAVRMAEEKINKISGTVSQSIGDLKDIFSTKVKDSLEYTLDDILKKIEISEITTKEFWEQAKKGSSQITMKDIWFIRSQESAKAHINDEISKAKMRVLIVAPQLSDIDINAIKACPPRVNIRIATFIDHSVLEHKAVLAELDQMQNVDYRHRPLQNLWGINKDYEEVVLCVLSETEIRGEKITEIAGIGSIINEHIKIFVPILEEAWVGSRKEIPPPLHEVVEVTTVKKPSLIQEYQEKKTREQEILDIRESIRIPRLRIERIDIEKKPLSEKIEIPKEKAIKIEDSYKPDLEDITYLSEKYDEIMRKLNNLTGNEIASLLEQYRTEYIEKKGYNSVLKYIRGQGDLLKNIAGVLKPEEIRDIKIKMKFWKQKLNL